MPYATVRILKGYGTGRPKDYTVMPQTSCAINIGFVELGNNSITTLQLQHINF